MGTAPLMSRLAVHAPKLDRLRRRGAQRLRHALVGTPDMIGHQLHRATGVARERRTHHLLVLAVVVARRTFGYDRQCNIALGLREQVFANPDQMLRSARGRERAVKITVFSEPDEIDLISGSAQRLFLMRQPVKSGE